MSEHVTSKKLDLLPCPFCGGDIRLETAEWIFRQIYEAIGKTLPEGPQTVNLNELVLLVIGAIETRNADILRLEGEVERLRAAQPPGDSYVVHRRHLVRGALSPMHSSDWIEVRLVPGLEPGCTSRGIEPRLANVAAANQAHEPDTSYSRNELLARLTECELALHNYAPHSEYFLRWELGGSALTKKDGQ